MIRNRLIFFNRKSIPIVRFDFKFRKFPQQQQQPRFNNLKIVNFSSSTIQKSIENDVLNSNDSKLQVSKVKRVASKSTDTTSPSMVQWHHFKDQHPGYLLLFQLGDFFELFFDDAKLACRILGLTLTKRRSKYKNNNVQVPMSGIPVMQLDVYLEKLIAAGVRVAICEQIETAAEAKKHKRLVDRQVTRLVTAGTLYEHWLPNKKPNYLLSMTIADDATNCALAWTDLSTGEVGTTSCVIEELSSELARLAPSEILLPQSLAAPLNSLRKRAAFNDDDNDDDAKQTDILQEPIEGTLPESVLSFIQRNKQMLITSRDESNFSNDDALIELKNVYGNKSETVLQSLRDNGCGILEINVIGALMNYLKETQMTIPKLNIPKREAKTNYMNIDIQARRTLEIDDAFNVEGNARTLLSVLDRTKTAGGGRLLRHRLAAPLLSIEDIDRRLDEIEFFIQNTKPRRALRSTIEDVFDIDRCLQRVRLGRASPRDLRHICATLDAAKKVGEILDKSLTKQTRRKLRPHSFLAYIDLLSLHEPLRATLDKALVANPSLRTKEGGYIADGYNDQLDKLRSVENDGELEMNVVQEEARKAIGVAARCKRNNVLGYFIELSNQHADKAPSDWIHCQTLKNCVRYRTPTLVKLDANVNEATSNALQLELELFEELLNQVSLHDASLQQLATALSSLDVALSLAAVAVEQRYTRPVLHQDRRFVVKQGRHASIEAAQRDMIHFTPNDCDLTPPQYAQLITGPNMGGKSTFLRQNALLAVMAQSGSFVPAEKFDLGIVDAIYSRVGSVDDVSNFQSSFMMEMQSVASTLNAATSRSLVVFDEVGRGTSTFDGMAIAWAVLEYLVDTIGCRVLFATHYKELATLSNDRVELGLLRLDAIESDIDGLVYLHRVEQGVARGSYGVHVAKIAGVPSAVVRRAAEVLPRLEQKLDVDSAKTKSN